MEFWIRIIEAINTKTETPEMYGRFHLVCWAITLLVAALLCLLYKKKCIKSVRRVLLVTALLVIVFEILKLAAYSVEYDEGIIFRFNWKHFPWQVCSLPMYIGLLASMTRGKLHDALCCFLATFAVFAGTAVMVYPGNVFVDIAVINIQTMICHGSMLCIGIFLYYTNHVKAEFKTILKATPVFVTCLGIAIAINEIGHNCGLNDVYEFDMFFISPYEKSILPIYKHLQTILPFWASALIYAAVFIMLSFLVLCVAMLLKRIIPGSRGKKKGAD